MEPLVILPVGTKVQVGDAIEGVITAVTIRNKDHLSYEMSWLCGGTHHREWLQEIEVRKVDPTQAKRRVGFIGEGGSAE